MKKVESAFFLSVLSSVLMATTAFGETSPQTQPAVSTASPQGNNQQQTISVPLEKRISAYKTMLDSILPMDEQKLQRLKDAQENSQKAISNLDTLMLIRSPVISVKPGPGVQPVVIHVAPMYATSIVFLDGTRSGSPWPIKSSENSTKVLNIRPIEKDGYALYLKPAANNPYFRALISVSLKSLPTPIPILVVSDGANVDATATIIVQGISPITMSRIRGGFASDSSPDVGSDKNIGKIINVLAGIPPSSASKSVRFKKNGLDAEIEGWIEGPWLWVRLPDGVFLTSPADKNESHAEGWTAYQIPYFDVLTLLYKNRIVNVEVNKDGDE